MNRITTASTVHTKLNAFTRQPLPFGPSPVEEMARLRDALDGGPRLLVKRDDAITFGFGGNKVRKLEYVLGQALDEGADTLVTMGGVQSNHARATAAASAPATAYRPVRPGKHNASPRARKRCSSITPILRKALPA